jgi:hypothetical protein
MRVDRICKRLVDLVKGINFKVQNFKKIKSFLSTYFLGSHIYDQSNLSTIWYIRIKTVKTNLTRFEKKTTDFFTFASLIVSGFCDIFVIVSGVSLNLRKSKNYMRRLLKCVPYKNDPARLRGILTSKTN